MENSCPSIVRHFLNYFYDDFLWERMFLRTVDRNLLVPIGQKKKFCLFVCLKSSLHCQHLSDSMGHLLRWQSSAVSKLNTTEVSYVHRLRTILLTFLSKGTRQSEYRVALLVTFHSFWGFSQARFRMTTCSYDCSQTFHSFPLKYFSAISSLFPQLCWIFHAESRREWRPCKEVGQESSSFLLSWWKLFLPDLPSERTAC